MSTFFGARAATITLASLLAWSIVEGFVAVIEYELVDVPKGVLPSFTARAVLVILGHFVGLIALLLAVRYAASGPRISRGRPSFLVLLVTLLFALMAAGGIAASVWFPKEVAEVIGQTRPVSELAVWGQQNIRLSIIAVASKATVLISAFLYGAWKWWLAARV